MEMHCIIFCVCLSVCLSPVLISLHFSRLQPTHNRPRKFGEIVYPMIRTTPVTWVRFRHLKRLCLQSASVTAVRCTRSPPPLLLQWTRHAFCRIRQGQCLTKDFSILEVFDIRFFNTSVFDKRFFKSLQYFFVCRIRFSFCETIFRRRESFTTYVTRKVDISYFISCDRNGFLPSLFNFS